MLRLFMTFIFSAALVLGSVVASLAQETNVKIFVESEGGWSPIPILKKGISASVINLNYHVNSWIHRFLFGQELVIPFLVDVKDAPPNDMRLYSLRLETPFTAKNSTVIVKIKPTTVKGSAAEVRAIFGINPSSISDDQLPIFYQKVRGLASIRIAMLGGNWSQLTDFHVQAIYVYLQTVRELNSRTFIVPPENINVAIDWLTAAIENQRARVNTAVGISNAKQVIEQVKNAESLRFGRLWQSIMNISNCREKYELLAGYLELLNGIPAGQRIRRVTDKTGVPKVSVISAMAQCLAKMVRCSEIGDVDARVRLNKVLNQATAEFATTFSPKLKTTLTQDISTLKNLLRDIEDVRPKICPAAGR